MKWLQFLGAALSLFLWRGLVDAQPHHSVIIREIMADPSPSAGLPSYEWIEIQNNSVQPVQLQNWRLADASSVSGPLSSYILLPDSSVILCSNSALPVMRNYGNALGVSSFPSLDNAGETLVLRSPSGQTIHAVSYETSWYRSALKEEGGWTLEMINTHEPCLGKENWIASKNAQGGSPGKLNSVNSTSVNAAAPVLLHAFTTDSLRIVLVFDRTIDSTTAVLPGNYLVQKGQVTIAGIRAEAPLFNKTELLLNSSMKADSVITVELINMQTCTGNKMSGAASAKTGRASNPAKGEWVVNEILFNPRSSGFDFLECLNNSHRILDLSQLYVCSRQLNGTLSSAEPLCKEPLLVFPGEYYCFTEDPISLAKEYLVANSRTVLPHNKLPSFPDTEGTVVLLDRQGNILDELHYREDWHFPLLNSKEGVSLERIRADGNTEEATNWHSAASSEGFATPGRKNSQQQEEDDATFFYEVSPKIFSPDMDGREDICTLSYQMEEPGQVATVSVLNSEGRLIRNLVPRATLSIKGHWNWNGLDNMGKAVPPGIYLFIVQQFGLNGKVRTIRLPVVMARSFNPN